ncbi:MAG TPA: RidA family protein [Acidimicrobiales bacterium]|nr:RidA family protein [Acidimicrobiales bacterium]
MDDKSLVPPGTPWGPIVGYSRAVRVGQWIAVAGTTASLPGGGAVGDDDIAEQTREAIRRIAEALAKLGGGLENVVRTRIFVTDINRWEEVGQVHGEFFADIRPASTMVEVNALIDPVLLVEVEADAVLPL